MYENYGPYAQSELDYRRERITSGASSRKSRHLRFPRVRRSTTPAAATR